MDTGAAEISRPALRPPGPWRDHAARLARGRLPLAPLTLAAAVGILAAPFLQPICTAAAASALLAAAALSGRWPLLAAATACLFAARAAWQEAPARALASARPGPEPAALRGVVASLPRPAGEGRWVFDCRTERVEFSDGGGPLFLLVSVRWAGEPPGVGDRVQAFGTWERLPPARNPGAFDAARWHAQRGVFSRLRVAHELDAKLLQRRAALPWQRLAAAAHGKMERALTAGLDPDSPQAHLILAMTLGDTRPLEESMLEDFRATGTFHLFSVSGLHVGMLGLLLWTLLRALRLPPAAVSALIIPALFFYALLTGWKPASVRAAVMAAFVLAGVALGRPAAPLNSLLAAAFFLLAANPRELFHPGFQLSFTVVIALLALQPPIEKILRSALAPDPFVPAKIYTPGERAREALAKSLAPPAAVALAAWVGSLPLTLAFFHLVSFAAVPVNMICVPLAFCVMAIAMLSVATAWLPAIATLFTHANWALASALIAIVQAVASIPGAFVFLGSPPGALRLTVLDMGSGAAALIETGNQKWLVDAGALKDFDRVLRPFLRSRGTNHLDGLILTHGDAAHVGAAAEVMRVFRPRLAAIGPLPERSPTKRQVLKEWARLGRAPVRLAAGQSLPLGHHATLEILYPPEDIRPRLADDKALVLRLISGAFRFLLLSDAGPATEEWLLQHERDRLPADVLIQGAHASGVARSEAFLQAVSPRLMIATHGEFPPAERLPAETLRWLETRSIPLLRQDLHGAIVLRTTSRGLEAMGFITGDRQRLAPR